MTCKARWISALGGTLILVACSSGAQLASPDSPSTSPHATDRASTTRGVSEGDARLGEGQAVAGWPEAQPHRFAPRSHARHTAPPPSRPPAFSTLPPFEDGSRQCFYEPEYRPHPRPYPRPVPYAHGGGITAKSSAGVRSRAPAKPSAAPPSSGDPMRGIASSQEATAYDSSGTSAHGSKGAPAESVKRRATTPRPDHTSPRPPVPPRDHQAGWGASVYLSNDDTMSLSSAQRVIYAIDNYAPIPAEHVRPHELLNYFSFDTARVDAGADFSVVPSIDRSAEDPSLWSLAFAVQGRPVTRQSRRNANISFVLDRSGSMRAEGRMDYVKRGLRQALGQLKTGDIVHLTLFDSSSCSLAKNFVVGRDSMSTLRRLVDRIEPTGSTNLHRGLESGYATADAAYQSSYTNRVVMITDAETNTGVTNERLIATVGRYYDQRRIRLSGVGVGRTFNDSLLDRLTERGRGAYVFLGSDAEVDAVFGRRFVSLVETVASDVHFRVHLPPSLALETFYGEEASTQKSRVQAIHYFAGTSQMFLSDVRSRYGELALHDDLMFTIEYEDPETGSSRFEEFAWNLRAIAGPADNLSKAQLVNRFARSLGQLAHSPVSLRGHGVGTWVDDDAARSCRRTEGDLARLARGIEGDPEVRRIRQLWSTYCDRYQAPRYHEEPVMRDDGDPVRTNDYAPRDRWPGAR